jgi:hypothetical protein
MMSKHVSVFKAHGPVEAESARAYLESLGFQAVLSHPGGNVFAFTFGPLDIIDVLVPEEEQSGAEAALEEMWGEETRDE